MTREEAVQEAADQLDEAKHSIGEQALAKHISIAQLYMTLAHEIGYENNA